MNVPTLHALIRRDPETAEWLLANELNWLQWLPNDDQQQCINELIDCAQSATLFSFARAIKEWKATAEVWHDPELVRHLLGPLSGEGFLWHVRFHDLARQNFGRHLFTTS